MKTIIFFISLISFTAIFFSCKKKNFNEEIINPIGAGAVVVNNLNPAYAQLGNTITINGKNFGTVASIVVVKINNTTVSFNLLNDSTITVIIPQGLGSGSVSVTKNNVATNGPNFEYLYTGNVTTFSGNGDTQPFTGTNASVGYGEPISILLDAQNNMYVSDIFNFNLRKIDANGNVTVLYSSQTGNSSKIFDISKNGRNYYLPFGNNNTIQTYNDSTNNIGLSAGYYSSAGYLDGNPGYNARFNKPFAIVKNTSNEFLISDYNNHCIRKMIPTGGNNSNAVSTYAGTNTDGDVNANGTNARLKNPTGLYIDANNDVLVCDAGNFKIKKIAANKDVTTIAGTTTGYVDGSISVAKFSTPISVVKDDVGNILVTELNNTIRCISPSGIVYTLAGTNGAGLFADGIGAAAKFNAPSKIIFAGNKTFYIADSQNRRIRKMTLL